MKKKIKEPEVIFCFNISADGEYCYHNSFFTEPIYDEYQEQVKENKNSKTCKIIGDAIEREKKNPDRIATHPHDILDDLFCKNIFLNFDFAKSLNLFDIVWIDCFTPKNELGKAIWQVTKMSGLLFIVSEKSYYSQDTLELTFEVTIDYDYFDCHRKLITQEIYSEPIQIRKGRKRRSHPKITTTLDFIKLQQKAKKEKR